MRDSKQLRSESSQAKTAKAKTPYLTHRSQTSLTVTQRSCVFCRDNNHSIFSCTSFNGLTVLDRFSNAKKLGPCLNCLGKGHGVSKCPSSYRCKQYRQPHHSLLHRHQQSESASGSRDASSLAAVNAAVERNHAPDSQVILATALVLVKDSSDGFQIGRVLLDSGSQVNFVNEKFAKALRLQKRRKSVDIVGIGVAETKISFQTQTTIRSRYNNSEVTLEFLIAPSITGYQPDSALSVKDWNVPRNLELADEYFYQASRIDLLLGAEAFFDLLQVGQIKLGPELPSLQKTSLGWIVSGRYKSHPNITRKSCCLSSKEDSLDRYVEKFWEIEEVLGHRSKWTEEQKDCEKHFVENIEVLPSGRLMVRLPFKNDPSCLGTSYDIAFRRFLALERRLSKNPVLKGQYTDFLREYQQLGHMTLVEDPNLEEPHYYLPHQCVIRPDSASTKLRVVFDASCCTSSHVSLNGILMVGPTIQEDLFTTLLRFRLHRYALTADIVKMYRQVLVHPSHRRFQFILWRENEHTPVKTYQLNTVTYGTSSAPFLAIRCLQYLADKNKEGFELGSGVLQSDFYVDDMLTGADDLDTLVQLQGEVVTLLNSAGFELAKWNSNSSEMVDVVHPQNKEIKLNESNLSSTLGIVWNPLIDTFLFSYKPNRTFSKFTKRSILSLSS